MEQSISHINVECQTRNKIIVYMVRNSKTQNYNDSSAKSIQNLMNNVLRA